MTLAKALRLVVPHLFSNEDGGGREEGKEEEEQEWEFICQVGREGGKEGGRVDDRILVRRW